MQPLSDPLDTARRPGRAFLERVIGTHTTLRGRHEPDSHLAALFEALPRVFGLPGAIAVPCAHASHALGIVTQTLLAPSDVAVLFEPSPDTHRAAVLASGARYVDAGRTTALAPDLAALGLVAGRHAPRLVLVDDPGDPSGHPLDAETCAVLAGAAPVLLVDASAARHPIEAARALAAVAAPARTIALVSLADPLSPGSPLLSALIAPADLGRALALVAGPASLGPRHVDAALAAIDAWQSPHIAARLEAMDHATTHAEAVLTDVARSFPGAVVHAGAGRYRFVECRGPDPTRVARLIEQRGFATRAFGPHPFRNGVGVDLW